MMLLFHDDGNGSRIMLSVRLWGAAAYADSSRPPYEMHLMDADRSWKAQSVYTPRLSS